MQYLLHDLVKISLFK